MLKYFAAIVLLSVAFCPTGLSSQYNIYIYADSGVAEILRHNNSISFENCRINRVVSNNHGKVILILETKKLRECKIKINFTKVEISVNPYKTKFIFFKVVHIIHDSSNKYVIDSLAMLHMEGCVVDFIGETKRNLLIFSNLIPLITPRMKHKPFYHSWHSWGRKMGREMLRNHYRKTRAIESGKYVPYQD